MAPKVNVWPAPTVGFNTYAKYPETLPPLQTWVVRLTNVFDMLSVTLPIGFTPLNPQTDTTKQFTPVVVMAPVVIALLAADAAFTDAPVTNAIATTQTVYIAAISVAVVVVLFTRIAFTGSSSPATHVN